MTGCVLVVSAAVALTAIAGSAQQPARQPTAPRPVRNDVPKPAGRELLVLRNHQLRKGGHEPFYRFSRDDYWPYFERLGARVVGQWKVIDPAAAPTADREDVYRLVRYASFEHWQMTRDPQMIALAGDGPAYERGVQGVRDRRDLEVGSRGAYFLEGEMAPDRATHMPGLAEQYELVKAGERPPAADREIAVRLGAVQRGDEIVVLRVQRIRKGAFDQFVDLTRTRIWPWEGKLGARPIGQWQVVHPTAPGGRPIPGLRFMTEPNTAYDEVVTLTRYASRPHMDAMAEDRAVFMSGNGPDFIAWRDALETQRGMTVATSVEIIQGFMYQSPPVFLPGVPEQYRRVK